VRSFRGRDKFLLIWTALCLLPMPLLVAGLAAPVPAGCFEYCGLSAQIGGWLIAVIFIVWLVVTLVASWVSTQLERQPQRTRHRQTLSAVASLGAGFLLFLVTIRVPGDRWLATVIVWISFVLAVVAGRALAAGARFSPVRWAALWFMAVATLSMVSAPFLRLADVQMNGLFVAFYAGLALLAIAAFREHTAERPGLALLAAGSFLAIVNIGYSLVFHDSVPFAVLAIPASTAGWIWIGVMLLRMRSSPDSTSVGAAQSAP
jgi:hypothetical protein